jgi:hypothetical protein
VNIGVRPRKRPKYVRYVDRLQPVNQTFGPTEEDVLRTDACPNQFVVPRNCLGFSERAAKTGLNEFGTNEPLIDAMDRNSSGCFSPALSANSPPSDRPAMAQDAGSARVRYLVLTIGSSSLTSSFSNSARLASSRSPLSRTSRSVHHYDHRRHTSCSRMMRSGMFV